jgi:hypothetical protein
VTLDLVKTICAVVSTLAGIAIPIVLYFAAQSIKSNDTRLAQRADTLRAMQGLDEKIAVILEKKVELDGKYGAQGTKRYEAQYIKSHGDVEDQVFRLLNLYEGICNGANQSLFDSELVESIRGDALRATWRDYAGYVDAHRGAASDNARAWNACETWVKLHPR